MSSEKTTKSNKKSQKEIEPRKSKKSESKKNKVDKKSKVPKEKDSKPKPSKICKLCNREKLFRHYQICKIYQTTDAIEAIKNLFSEIYKNFDTMDFTYKFLRKEGLDSGCLQWVDCRMKDLQKLPLAEDNIELISFIIKAVMNMFNMCEIGIKKNVQESQVRKCDEGICHICSKTLEKCADKRKRTCDKITRYVFRNFEIYDNQEEIQKELEKRNLRLTHLGIDILMSLVDQFLEQKKLGKCTQQATDNFIDFYMIQYSQSSLEDLLYDVDTMIGF